ncbi:methyltransferase domain-containing protein [Tenacibaculum adriaticum]|uniref:methyltransferase domain-containing protein n=1 Tax=Tenacibaculum adriaticum TaxID=413713 RepID=UPI0011E6D772|nr:methyltransferase domain-containing protein [Tenacibaculum adriaticum]
MDLSEEFWNNKYRNNKTGWDLGAVSTPLKTYFDQLTNKDLKILIPGGGNSYEAEYLFKKGFTNVFVIDIAEEAIENIKKRLPNFPEENLIHNNFFNLKESYDLIIEQTFFCALNPDLRSDYTKKMNELLNENGKLVGLLFDAELNFDHPPFGGGKKEYVKLFQPYFDIQKMSDCYNSSKGREGMELFINVLKKHSKLS